MRFEPLEQTLTLIGADEPRVTLLAGDRQRTTCIINIFKGGIWTLYQNNTFVFQAAPTNDKRSGSYSVSGSYTSIDDGVVTIHAIQQHQTNSDILDGVMRVQGESIQMEIIKTCTSTQASDCVAHISQTLYPQPTRDRTAQAPKTDIALPSIYRIVLNGRVDDDTFGPIHGTLKLLPTRDPDTNPFCVELTTERKANIGSIFWSSFLPRPEKEGLQCAIIVLIEQQVLLTTTGKPNAVSPSWFTMKTSLELGRAVQSVSGQQGQMTLAPDHQHISGMIYLQGISNHRQDSTYQAYITGSRIDEPKTGKA
jgi:hypothetical protein